MSPKLKQILFSITILLSVTLYTLDILINDSTPITHLVKVAFLVFVCLLGIYRQME